MPCEGLGLFNRYQVGQISAYLQWKKAKTLKEKEANSSLFIKSNYERMRKDFCANQCPFKEKCSFKKKVG